MGTECRYEVAQAAYVKLALHALKHPAAAVNGLLVGRLLDSASSPAVVSVVNAVPLSHHPHHLPLLPTLELALTLVEDHFAAQSLSVVGYYHANARHDDADLAAVAKRVGDHIFRYFPRAAVLLLDNEKLEEAVKGKSRDPVVQLYTRDSSKSWRQAGSDGSSQLTLKEPSTNVVFVTDRLFRGAFKSRNDYPGRLVTGNQVAHCPQTNDSTVFTSHKAYRPEFSQEAASFKVYITSQKTTAQKRNSTGESSED